MAVKKKTKTQMKHELFVLRFLEYQFDHVKAYKEVYGEKKSKDTTYRCAWEILNNPQVQEMIEVKAKKMFDKSELNVQKILASLRDIVAVCTQRKKVKVVRWTDDGYEEVEGYERHNPQGANKALETLGKYFDLFVNKTEITGKDGGPITTKDVSNMSDEELYKYING